MLDRASGGQQRRLRVASITLALFAVSFLLLGFLSLHENVTDTTGATEYLLTGTTASDKDPLVLTDFLTGLELTGVSEDGSIVGYMSERSATELCLDLKDVLQRDGWSIDDDEGQGVLSFYRVEAENPGENTLLVQCLPVGQGSSLVIKRW
jgi:hypothetical protein